jgi:hypothetical protein
MREGTTVRLLAGNLAGETGTVMPYQAGDDREAFIRVYV